MADGKIVSISYDEGGDPFSIETEGGDYYDVVRDHGGDLIYQLSGGGSGGTMDLSHYRGRFWISPDVQVKGVVHETAARLDKPLHAEDEDGFPIVTLDDLCDFLSMTEVDGFYYDHIAEAYYSDDERSPYTFWSDLSGDYAGPGSDTEWESHREHVLGFVEAIGCREDLIAALESGEWEARVRDYITSLEIDLWLNGRNYSREIERLERNNHKHQLGFGWLYCLRPGDDRVAEAVAETIKWLKEGD